MFLYSFLVKNLACVFLFDAVRLLIFEVSRFQKWFLESPKQQGKNVPSLSCSKASARICNEEMPYA